MTTITTTRKQLLTLLKATAPITNAQGALPMLRGVRISTSGRSATLEASDLTVWRTLKLEGSVAGRRSSVVVGAKQLQALCRDVLSDDDLQLEFAGDALTLRSNGTTLRLTSMSSDSWPSRPIPSGDVAEIELSAADVAKLRQIAPAASDDYARPILTGILLADGYAIATDSYRLAVARIDAAFPGSILFPAEMVERLPTAGVTLTIDPKIEVGGAAMWVNPDVPGGSDTYRARLIDGDFPSWQKLVAVKFKTVVTADRQSLLTAADQATKAGKALDAERMPMVITRSDDTSVTVTLRTQLHGEPALSTTAACRRVYKAWPQIAFNPAFMADGLRMLGGTHVRIEAIDSLKPVLMRSEKDVAGDIRYLLMPVKIS